jgi:hypothetical protein
LYYLIIINYAAILALVAPAWHSSHSMATAPGAMGAGRLCDTLSGPGNRAAQGKRRRLDRRNTEEAVERAITEHLGDQSVLTTSVMKVDGISLKELQLNQGISMVSLWVWAVWGLGGACLDHGYCNGFPFVSNGGVICFSSRGCSFSSQELVWHIIC